MLDLIECSRIAAAIFAGLLLGGLYFGGLWWTVNRMPGASHPLNLYFGSLIIRLTVVMVAFYGVLTYAGWPRLGVSLIAFIAVRLALIRLLGRIPSTDLPGREPI